MKFRAALVALIGLGLLAPQADASPAGNLLPNWSFEDGLNKQSAQGIDQPLLPMGWAVEGNAGFFDHSPHERKSGRYSAAISIPAGGKRVVCADQPVGCKDNVPLNMAKDTAARAYSVNPAWRPALPVNVAGGRTYIVQGWTMWTFATIAEGGSLVQVRWLDANNVPIRTDVAFKRIAQNQAESNVLNWTFFQVGVTAPSNAAKAVPLFGAADDVWNSKINFDDVAFYQV